MNSVKYGNKLINLINKVEKLFSRNKNTNQIGGGNESSIQDELYSLELSESGDHVSILVHLEKDGDKNANELEEGEENQDGNQVYSMEQQLRLGCDEKGQMYKYSIVLTLIPK